MKREKSLKVSPNKNPDPPGHASPFLYSFLVALGLFSLECLFFKPFFHINDDDWALFISKGVGIALKPDAHLFYNNILLGQMLKSLYSLFPGFGWYTDLLLLTQFLGFWALLAALLARPGGKFKFLFSAAIFLLVDGYYFDQTNYTFCTFLAAQGGFFLFASMFERKDPAFQNPALALGSACLLISSLLRLEAFCFSVLTSLPFLAWSLWKGRGHRRNLYAVSILALLILACALFDSFCYRSDPAWGEFTKFNRYSASKSWTAYEYNGQTKPFFDEVDWTRNDLALFQDWYYQDIPRYSLENVEKLAKHFPHKPVTFSGDFFPLFGSFPAQTAVFCLFTLLLLCSTGEIFFLLLSALWTLAWIYFLVRVAYAPERAYLPSLTFLAALALYFSFSKSSAEKPAFPFMRKRAEVFLVLLWVFMLPTLWWYGKLNVYQRAVDRAFHGALTSLQPKDDQLYVVWDSSFPYQDLGASDDFEVFKHFHIFALAPFSRSPLGRAMLDHFGIKNLFRDLVDNPRFFLICSAQEGAYYQQYMLEKYRMEIVPERTYGCPFFQVFRIHSRPAVSRAKAG